MEVDLILRVVAFVGAVIVGLSALMSLQAEWPKRNLDDHVTKVMLALLALGCFIVIMVAFGVFPGIATPAAG
jgi:NADH:ubiquinone oxidoreductase subunit 6 (subunit J)